MAENDPLGRGAAEELSFTHVEPVRGGAAGEAAATACAACGGAITDGYYSAGPSIVCIACGEKSLAGLAGGSGGVRVVRAILYGLGAGVAGALLWGGIRIMTGYDIGLIAIVVGLMVGGAVRAGAQGRGGWVYQLIALVVTYMAIGASFATELFQAEDVEWSSVPLLELVVFYAFTVPVLAAKESVIIALIFAFALYEAWKLNKGGVEGLAGPFSMARTPARQS